MKRIVVFSGAGVSAESGLSTFRDHGGLWDQFSIEEVATIEAWNKDPEKVIDFYNLRRDGCRKAKPNLAHQLIAKLESKYLVYVITQNIDDLHERAGSSKVLHLHGEIIKSRSVGTLVTFKIASNKGIKYGDKCPDGFLLRPDVVWFGEGVPKMDEAVEITKMADYIVIIGTSLEVYPAAGLINYTPMNCVKYLIDPNKSMQINNIRHIPYKATVGMKKLFEELMTNN